MGARTSMLVIADGDARDRLCARPVLDRTATGRLVVELFPKETLEPLADDSLQRTSPRDDEILAGCFEGVTVLAAREFALDRPSRLDRRFLDHAGTRTSCLHAMHSVVDWFAYAVWHGGALARSLSLSPDGGILEEIGAPMAFEVPFWSGARALEDEGAPAYPFPFHPLELGEAALAALFGYVLEGPTDAARYDPGAIPLMRFHRRKRWFKR